MTFAAALLAFAPGLPRAGSAASVAPRRDRPSPNGRPVAAAAREPTAAGDATIARDESSGAASAAWDVVRRRSIFVGDEESIDPALVDTPDKLRAFLSRRDFYADYLSADDYAKFARSERRRSAGVGLALQKLPSGDIACFPAAGGPARRAGIATGDRLVSIDGHRTVGLSLPTLVALASGAAGTVVRLELVGPDGRRRTVAIRRVELVAPDVHVEQRTEGLRVIAVPSFTANTRADLAFLLGGPAADRVTAIDLPGNARGDFYAAVDSAMLFVAPGERIASVRSRGGVAHYASTLADRVVAGPVVLWQDATTASAAEVFIAALVGNHRAVSIGVRSFGKGTRQDVVDLGPQGTLILTTGYLQGPDGVEFDGRGLEPTLPMRPGDTAGYLAKTRQSTAAPR